MATCQHLRRAAHALDRTDTLNPCHRGGAMASPWWWSSLDVRCGSCSSVVLFPFSHPGKTEVLFLPERIQYCLSLSLHILKLQVPLSFLARSLFFAPHPQSTKNKHKHHGQLQPSSSLSFQGANEVCSCTHHIRMTFLEDLRCMHP
jgi:hypothetical protein